MKLIQTALLAISLLMAWNATALADDKALYDQHCGSCHNGGFKGFMAGAPKIGKKSAWEEYFASSIDDSKTIVFNGSKKHKAMGEELNLTVEEVSAAVDYILSTIESSQ